MRLILYTTLFLFLNNASFSQSKNDSIIKKYLFVSKNKKDIIFLEATINDFKANYNHLQAYIPSINPLNPKKDIRFTSGFKKRLHPIYNTNKMHFGIDIAAKAGTPVHATAKGVVIVAKKSPYGYGNRVIIKHDFGFTTLYGHMFELIVEKGFKVEKSEIIGFVGSTGASTGYHLHYEVKKNNKHLNPVEFLN